MNMDDKPNQQFVTSLARGLSILRCFSRPRHSLSVSDIARRVGLSQPTTWRLCQTLLECGYLVKAGNLLTVGAPSAALGYAAVRGMAPAELILPYMSRLTERSGATSALNRRHGTEMLSVERVDGGVAEASFPVGWHAPLTSVASGLAIISALSELERQAILDALNPSEDVRMRVATSVVTYQRDGYVRFTHAMEGQYTSVAVALFELGSDPREQWALSCGAVGERWTPEFEARVIAELMDAQALLTPALGALATR